MANFRTHLVGAAIPATIAAGLAIAGELVTWAQGAACLALGVLGGILPDVDAERSLPTRILFGVLAIAAAAAVVLSLRERAAIELVALAAVIAVVVVGVGLRALTGWLCVHRGLVHSIPVAALLGAATAAAAWRLWGLAPTPAWLLGAALTGGFIVHLTLDELFSVDLVGARMKRSFGTALKLGSLRRPIATALVYAAVIGMVWAGPPLDRVARDLTAKRTRAAIAGALGR